MVKHLKFIALVVLMIAASAAVGAFGARWLGTSPATYIEGDYSAQRSATGNDVVLLGTAWCGYCKQTREYLAKRGVKYADLDVENSKQAYEWAQAIDAPGVPVLLIGDRQIRGFRPDEIEAALAAWQQQAAGSG